MSYRRGRQPGNQADIKDPRITGVGPTPPVRVFNPTPSEIFPHGEAVRQEDSRRKCEKVKVGDPIGPVTGYQNFQFYLTTDGQTRNDGGNPIIPVDLSSFNAALAQWGFSFPGEAADINQWARSIQLPTNYDNTRPIIVTLHVIQE